MSNCPPPKLRNALHEQPTLPVDEVDLGDLQPAATCSKSATVIGTLPSLLVEELMGQLEWLITDEAAWSEAQGVGAFQFGLRGTSPFTRPGASAAQVRAAAKVVSVNARFLIEAKAQAKLSHVRLAQCAGLGTMAGATDALFVCELIDALMTFSSALTDLLKSRLQVPRPALIEAGLAELIPRPSSSSYPGGHALQMGMLHRILADLRPATATSVEALASRIAKNREYMGLHTSLDTEAGWAAGEALAGQFLQALAAGSLPACAMAFDRAREECLQPSAS